MKALTLLLGTAITLCSGASLASTDHDHQHQAGDSHQPQISSDEHDEHENDDNHGDDGHAEKGHQDEHSHGDEDEHSDSTSLTAEQQALAAIVTEVAGPAELVFSDLLFGVIAAPADGVFRINAPYPGLVAKVHVRQGERVKKGQKLLTLSNSDTLQQYTLTSPSDGEVGERHVNAGDRADQGPLLEIVNLSNVWVEMSAFPENIEKLAVGQTVTVNDLHHHEAARGQIDYVAPHMTGGHIARTRATIANVDGHWRPGMHIQARVETDRREVALAIKKTALQRFEGEPAVFVKHGEEFEVRKLKLGAATADRIEVLAGLEAGDEVVSENSFIIKADILKAGAAHEH